jgi:hypothetical protein
LIQAAWVGARRFHLLCKHLKRAPAPVEVLLLVPRSGHHDGVARAGVKHAHTTGPAGDCF